MNTLYNNIYLTKYVPDISNDKLNYIKHQYNKHGEILCPNCLNEADVKSGIAWLPTYIVSCYKCCIEATVATNDLKDAVHEFHNNMLY